MMKEGWVEGGEGDEEEVGDDVMLWVGVSESEEEDVGNGGVAAGVGEGVWETMAGMEKSHDEEDVGRGPKEAERAEVCKG